MQAVLNGQPAAIRRTRQADMFDDLLEQATVLKEQSKPFVLATVVACKPPTSAKPGAKAIVQQDGSFHGWVGGSCAQPLVTQESLKALQDGQARLVLLAPNPQEVDVGLEGTVLIPMTCQSEGTLAIYLEPCLPKPELFVIGQSPMARSLAALGDSLEFRVYACDPSATRELFPNAETLVQQLKGMRELVGPRSYVVVATMGHYDEEALEEILSGKAGYVGLVASPRRGRAVIEYLQGRGISSDALQRVKYPAGLDIGAETPEEIALSILTEIVQRMRADWKGVSPEPATQATRVDSIDPICNMTINVTESRYHSNYNGTTFHFCCLSCKEEFERAPDRYAVPVS